MKGNARLIGLTGPAGCGKSTARKALVEKGWIHVSMAGTLKAMARVFFEAAGINADECINGRLKETPLEEIGGKSPRYIMQTLGAEWGRDLIETDIWVSLAKAQCEALMANGFDVVIDDIRFDNEADMVRSLGGTVASIIGRGGINGNHVSEFGVNSDFELNNMGTEEQFKTDVLYIFHGNDLYGNDL